MSESFLLTQTGQTSPAQHLCWLRASSAVQNWAFFSHQHPGIGIYVKQIGQIAITDEARSQHRDEPRTSDGH